MISFRDLDELIERLEKAVSPGSPPVMLNGHLVIWRTIRGFRVALELHPGAGKYNFDGKSYRAGKVLVGPPSLTGKNIGEVDNDTWNGLSGSGTKANFGSPSPEEASSLKRSVKNSLKDDDTRHEALDNASPAEVINIARSAGFQDTEIKEALGGKVFRNALSDEADSNVADSNVVSLADHKKKKGKPEETPEKAPEETPEEDLKPTGTEGPSKPEGPSEIKPSPNKPTSSGSSNTQTDGNLAVALEALRVPGVLTPDKKQKIAEALLSASKALKGDFFRKQVEGLAYGLMSGDYKLDEVRSRIAALTAQRAENAPEPKTLTDSDVDKLHDKAITKEAVEDMQRKIEEMKEQWAKESREAEAAQREWFLNQIELLASRLRNQQAVQQLTVVRNEIKTKRLGGNSIILRILQILRFILAFIPG